MVAVRRIYIDIDWTKMQTLHKKIDKDHIWCIKSKWNPFKENWSQGFDSDCGGHCSDRKYCYKAFGDKRCHLENHLKPIIVEFEKKIRGHEEEVNIVIKEHQT